MLIFLEIFKNLLLLFISSILGTVLCLIFYPLYFESYYCYFTTIILLIVFILLFVQKKYLIIIYMVNFLVFTGIFSYGTYKAFFDSSFSEKEKIKTVEELEERCKNEPKDTKNFNCSRYFYLLDLCKEKTGKIEPLDCKDYIVYGSRIKNIKK